MFRIEPYPGPVNETLLLLEVIKPSPTPTDAATTATATAAARASLLSWLVPPIGSGTLVLLLLAYYTYVSIKGAIRTARESPLARIPPAHPLAPYTPLWILWKRWLAEEYDAVHAAHLRDGPVVRIGPNEIAVNKMDGGISIVHGVPGFDKTKWYDFFVNHEKRNAFSTYTPKAHAPLRKRSAYVYSKTFVQTNILALDVLTSTSLGRYVSQIEATLEPAAGAEVADSQSPPEDESSEYDDNDDDYNDHEDDHKGRKTRPGVVDVLPLNLAYALDVVTTLLWGWGAGTKMLEDAAERDEWARRYHEAHSPASSMFLLLELPVLTSLVASLYEDFLPRTLRRAKKWLEDWAVTKTRHADEDDAMTGDLWRRLGRAPPEMITAYSQIKKAMLAEQEIERPAALPPPGEDEQVLDQDNRLEAASECLDHIYATRDTFGITLTYIMHALSKSASLQDRLYVELVTALPEPIVWAVQDRDVAKLQILAMERRLPALLEALPLLDAIVREGLRLRNIYPLAQPRLVPAGGPAAHLCGFEVPPGTKVCCFAASTHRMPDIFEQPDDFDPDRWLQDDRAKLAAMDASFWPMGRGSRICLGQHLAMEMLRFAIMALYVRYATDIVSDRAFGNGGGYCGGGPDDHLVLKFLPREIEFVDEQEQHPEPAEQQQGQWLVRQAVA